MAAYLAKENKKNEGSNLAGKRGFLPRVRTLFNYTNVSILNLLCGTNDLYTFSHIPSPHSLPYVYIIYKITLSH